MEENVTILRVQLDEGKTEGRIKQLVLDIEATRKAQQALTAERKAGTVADEEFAKRSVELATQLKGQRNEQTALTKNLELYRTAAGELGNTYKGTQAQLSLAQRQFQELQGSQDNSTESTKALAGVVDELRNKLKETDAQQSLFVRNVGNYPKGENLESLVRQLVELQEQTKNLTAGTEEAARAQMRIVGFQTQAAQAGAKEGKTFEETTNFVRQYGEAIRPATADLVKLTQQQERAAEAGQDLGEEAVRIGFRMGAAKKAIQDATTALKVETDVAEETGSAIATSLGQAGEAAELLGIDVGGLESGFNRAKKGVEIAKASFGSLRTAMLAVPIFLLLAGITALVAYFTKTREGANQLETAVAKVGAIFDVIIDRAGVLGKAVTQLFSGEFTAAAETARLSYKGIGDEMQREITLAGQLSTARQQLERDQISNIATNAKLTSQIEAQKNLRDNEFLSISKRKEANEKAFKLEMQRQDTETNFARRRLALIDQEIERRGGLEKATNEQIQERGEAEKTLYEALADSAGKQNELITNRFQLEQERLDKYIERRGQVIALEAALLDKQLANVKKESNEELSLLQAKARNAYAVELNVKNLTLKQKLLADTKYEQASLALGEDFAKRRALAAYDAELATVQAELVAVCKGTVEETELKIEAINTVLAKELASLDKRGQNTEKAALLRARAEADIDGARYAQAQQSLDAFLQGEKNTLEEARAKNKITEEEYNRQILAADEIAAGSRLQLAKQFGQDAAAAGQQLAEARIKQAQAATDAEKHAAEVKQEILSAQLAAANNYTDTIVALFGEESEAGRAALAIKKVLALAEIGLNLQKQLVANALAGTKIAAEAPPFTIPLGAAYTTATNALAITAAALAAANVLKLQRGGIAEGPRHAQGGIPLYRNGRSVGIEIEGGEPVLTRGVSRNPLLLSMASTINQLAGGRAFAPALPTFPRLALGGIAKPLIMQQLRGNAGEGIDYERLAQATAKALRQNPPVNRWSDFKEAEGRNGFTDSQSSA